MEAAQQTLVTPYTGSPPGGAQYKLVHDGAQDIACGENSLRFSPALNAKASEVDTCLTIFEEAMKKAGC